MEYYTILEVMEHTGLSEMEIEKLVRQKIFDVLKRDKYLLFEKDSIDFFCKVKNYQKGKKVIFPKLRKEKYKTGDIVCFDEAFLSSGQMLFVKKDKGDSVFCYEPRPEKEDFFTTSLKKKDTVLMPLFSVGELLNLGVPKILVVSLLKRKKQQIKREGIK